MDLLRPSANQIGPILRPLKTVAAGVGSLTDRERAMLAVAQEIFGSSHDLDCSRCSRAHHTRNTGSRTRRPAVALANHQRDGARVEGR